MSLQQASKWEEKLLHEPFSTIAFFPPQNQQFYFKLVAETSAFACIVAFGLLIIISFADQF